MGEHLEAVLSDEGRAQVSEITRKSAEELKKEYDRFKKVPEEEYREYNILKSKSEAQWEQAKSEADFETFRPNLEKLVEFKRKFVNYWGYEGHPYNTLLDDYEPGVTVDILDDVFGKVREGLIL